MLKEKNEEILNISNYCLFDNDEDDKKEEKNSDISNKKKSNDNIDFFYNPKTQMIKKSKVFNNINKDDNFLMNSFELLGQISNRDKDTEKKENIIKEDNNIYNNNFENNINNDINNSNSDININNYKFEPNKLNFNYNNNNNSEEEENLDSNFNINNFIYNSNNKINENTNLQNFDKNDIKLNIDNRNNIYKNNQFHNNDNNINKYINNEINNNNNLNINDNDIKNIMNDNYNNNNKFININNQNNNISNINININEFNSIKQNQNNKNKDDFNIKNKLPYINNNLNNNINNNKNMFKSCLIYDEKKINVNDKNNDNNIINKSLNLNVNEINDNNEKNNSNKNNKLPNINVNLSQRPNAPIKVNESKFLKDKMNIQKIHENLKIKQNKNKLQFNSKTVIIKKHPNLSPFKIKKETEEERIKREKEEKEQKEIRDKLQCYLCFGKVINARICRNCKKIACDQCVKNMLNKTGKCLNCQKESNLDDIISIPWMEDFTSFFINNVDNYQNQKIKMINNEIYGEDEDMKDEFNNNEKDNIKEDNINNDFMNEDEEEIVQFCEKHKDKKIEYFCLQCNEYFCSKCLMFTNTKVAEKHKNHNIMDIQKLKKYNINEAIKEYKKLKDSSFNLDQLLRKYNEKRREILVKQQRINFILDNIKIENEQKYSEQINKLDDLISKISKQKGNIDNSIDSVPNSFNNIIEREDYGQGEYILEELKKLNIKFDEKENNLEKYNFKSNLCFEWFESESIKLFFPNNGHYIEEFIFIDKQLDFIPDHVCRFKSQLLGGNIVFILSIEIKDEYYYKNSPKFYAHIISKNLYSSNTFIIFYGDIYSNGVQILSEELPFEQIKQYIDNENSFEIRLNVLKRYYK